MWSNFKRKINDMNQTEKQDFLKQLHDELIYARTRRFQTQNSMRCRTLRKQIAYLKTIMGVKGFSYMPRE